MKYSFWNHSVVYSTESVIATSFGICDCFILGDTYITFIYKTKTDVSSFDTTIQVTWTWMITNCIHHFNKLINYYHINWSFLHLSSNLPKEILKSRMVNLRGNSSDWCDDQMKHSIYTGKFAIRTQVWRSAAHYATNCTRGVLICGTFQQNISDIWYS